MTEPASLVWRKTNAIWCKEGEKHYERKFVLKTISKFYPKIEPLYQGILLHENSLETRLGQTHQHGAVTFVYFQLIFMRCLGCWASFMFIVITPSWNAITCFLESSWVWDRFLLLLLLKAFWPFLRLSQMSLNCLPLPRCFTPLTVN